MHNISVVSLQHTFWFILSSS